VYDLGGKRTLRVDLHSTRRLGNLDLCPKGVVLSLPICFCLSGRIGWNTGKRVIVSGELPLAAAMIDCASSSHAGSNRLASA